MSLGKSRMACGPRKSTMIRKSPVSSQMALGAVAILVSVAVGIMALSAVHKVHEGHVAVYYRGGALLPVIEVLCPRARVWQWSSAILPKFSGFDSLSPFRRDLVTTP